MSYFIDIVFSFFSFAACASAAIPNDNNEAIANDADVDLFILVVLFEFNYSDLIQFSMEVFTVI